MSNKLVIKTLKRISMSVFGIFIIYQIILGMIYLHNHTFILDNLYSAFVNDKIGYITLEGGCLGRSVYSINFRRDNTKYGISFLYQGKLIHQGQISSEEIEVFTKKLRETIILAAESKIKHWSTRDAKISIALPFNKMPIYKKIFERFKTHDINMIIRELNIFLLLKSNNRKNPLRVYL